MDELKTAIDLKSLTDKEIKEKGFELLDLWMFKSESGDTYGPYDTKSLKMYIEKYHYLLEGGQVYNLEIEAWYEIFSLPQFQRRKPKLVPTQGLVASNDFYLLIKGQKEGPYTSDEIQHKLDGGRVLPSTEVSIDNGQSWIKLYEHHLFDRRYKKTNQNLPFSPQEGVLKAVDKSDKEAVETNETEDALAKLAFIGNNPEGSFDNTQKLHLFQNPHKNQKQSHKAFYGFTFGAVFVLVGMFTFIGTKSDKSQYTEAPVKVKREFNSPRSKKANRFPSSVKPTRAKFKKPVAPVMEKFEIKKTQRFEESENNIENNQYETLEEKNAQFKAEIFESSDDRLDINDPEIREELTRHLAGEGDFEDEGPDAQAPIEEFFEDHEAIIEENQFED